MGNIINVVAVLEIHMLKPAVAIMKPPSSLRGFPPAATKILRANLRCRFHCSSAKAMRKPPRNKNTYFEP